TLLAIVLCIMVIILYNIFFAPKVVPPSPQALVPEKVIEVPKEEALPLPEIPIIESRDIMVETDLVKAIFTTQGARLKSYWLKNYDYELIYPTEENKYPLSLEILGQPGLISENWKVDKERLILNENNPTGEVNFTYLPAGEAGLNSQGLKITKTLKFYNDSYKIDAKIAFQNITSRDVYIPEYRLSWGPGIKEEEQKAGRRYGQFSGPVSFINGKLEKDTLERGFLKPPSVKVGIPTIHQGKIGWVALKSKYFMAALVPSEAAQATVIEKDGENKATVGIKMVPFSIKGKETISHEFTIYPGPKDYELVKGLGLGLEQAVDLAWWSWVTPISLILLKLFKWFYKIIPNYGVAIILITLLTKVILLPFTQKSFTHMRAMQAIQPKINALREKHKSNPQELNKHMMRLYKEHKVNPLGGCFPMLLQMPIFFALFGLLYTSIDLRGAGFIWWIKDLSLPDTVGYLAGFPINILPILMGLTTVIQQKMTTVDPRQAKMMLLMPIFMTFIFYNFASGLVLYWLMTNILTIGQQYIIAKRMPTTAQ
ncbi:membrane protein insertase YidC, partial [bacterium]|nr:membrane protein insertase YidC [bacterium]